jgi:FNIP Repeat
MYITLYNKQISITPPSNVVIFDSMSNHSLNNMYYLPAVTIVKLQVFPPAQQTSRLVHIDNLELLQVLVERCIRNGYRIGALFIERPYFSQRSDIMQKINISPQIVALHLGHGFNAKVDDLPDHLKILSLGNSFNQPVKKLPAGLTYLSLGNSFNQKVEALPSGLTHLILGNSFNKSLDKLPGSLKVLRVGNAYNKKVNKLPDSLRELHLGSGFKKSIADLPSRIAFLKIGELP